MSEEQYMTGEELYGVLCKHSQQAWRPSSFTSGNLWLSNLMNAAAAELRIPKPPPKTMNEVYQDWYDRDDGDIAKLRDALNAAYDATKGDA